MARLDTTGVSARGLLWLPALGVAAFHYRRLGDALAAHGILLHTMEWRGTGASHVRASRANDWGYRELLEDSAEALARLQRAHPECEWGLGGHSLGGQLAALLAGGVARGAYPHCTPTWGLMIVATGVPYWRNFSGAMRWLVRSLAASLPAVTGAFGYFPGHLLRFAGREAHGVMRDWRQSALHDRYVAQGITRHLEDDLGALAVPLLSILFADDRLAPLASLRALQRRMPRCHSTERLLDAQALGVRANHFAWLKRPGQVAHAIHEFSSRQNPPGNRGSGIPA